MRMESKNNKNNKHMEQKKRKTKTTVNQTLSIKIYPNYSKKNPEKIAWINKICL
jgi:hypothetical protein